MHTTWTSFRFDIVMMRARSTVTDVSLTPLVQHSILVTVIVTTAPTRFHLHSPTPDRVSGQLNGEAARIRGNRTASDQRLVATGLRH